MNIQEYWPAVTSRACCRNDDFACQRRSQQTRTVCSSTATTSASTLPMAISPGAEDGSNALCHSPMTTFKLSSRMPRPSVMLTRSVSKGSALSPWKEEELSNEHLSSLHTLFISGWAPYSANLCNHVQSSSHQGGRYTPSGLQELKGVLCCI